MATLAVVGGCIVLAAFAAIWLTIRIGKYIASAISFAAAVLAIGTFVWSQKDTITSFMESQSENVEQACGYAGTIGLGCK